MKSLRGKGREEKEEEGEKEKGKPVNVEEGRGEIIGRKGGVGREK